LANFLCPLLFPLLGPHTPSMYFTHTQYSIFLRVWDEVSHRRIFFLWRCGPTRAMAF